MGGCARCFEKDAVFIEVRNNVRKATEALRPFKTGSFAFYEKERARELENRMAAKKSTLSAMNQGIIEESGLLHNLVEGVVPKLKREKQFGTMFERKKNDVVVSQDKWNAMYAMIRGRPAPSYTLLRLPEARPEIPTPPEHPPRDIIRAAGRPLATAHPRFCKPPPANSQLLGFFYSTVDHPPPPTRDTEADSSTPPEHEICGNFQSTSE